MQRYDIHYLPIAEKDLNEIADYLLEHSINAAIIKRNRAKTKHIIL